MKLLNRDTWVYVFQGLLIALIARDGATEAAKEAASTCTELPSCSPLTSRKLMICNGNTWIHWSAPGITYEKPIPSCDAAGPGAISGMYWLQPNGWKSPFEIFCDFSLVERGCALIWKHSYFEVKPSALMTTFSKFNKPCFDLSTGWCNVGHKEAIPGSEQMTVAYHNGRVGYAYKGDRNPLLGKEWKGGILNNAFKIVDHCTASNGVRPEPTILSTGIPGLTWDKHNPGVHTGNCDTDEYRKGKGSDCRWQNCKLPKSLSPTAYNVQMTVAVFLC